MVTGDHPSGANSGLTEDELVDKFNALYDGKVGVKEKVLEVARRRCQLVDNADGNRVWLQWRHSVEEPK
ncbi:hypothetical protein MPER_12715 [Moniliophthora perniciosa FA553]|nr:hypothetical protein MPER_12715 [Moniliophthora perniciosa FA553]